MSEIVRPMRAATMDDMPALLELSRCYHDEAHAWLPFDQPYVAEQFRARTIDTMDGITLLMEQDNAIIGYLAAVTSMFFSAPVRLAAELAFYVHPDHRGHGMLMVDEFEAWARFKACAFCALSMNEFPDPKRSEVMVRAYRRRGYEPYERGFLKRL